MHGLCSNSIPFLSFSLSLTHLSLAPSASSNNRLRRNGVGVFSSHSNPRILKSNRGKQRGSSYMDDAEEEDDDDEDAGKEESEGDDSKLSDVLSLSLEGNLKPKYLYLVNELRNEVQSLTKYPMYLSLSLDQRIRPRHRFLVSLKKAPKGPFPLSSFVPTDECFCQQWAGTSVDKYLAFRQKLLLTEFAKKYGKKRILRLE